MNLGVWTSLCKFDELVVALQAHVCLGGHQTPPPEPEKGQIEPRQRTSSRPLESPESPSAEDASELADGEGIAVDAGSSHDHLSHGGDVGVVPELRTSVHVGQVHLDHR